MIFKRILFLCLLFTATVTLSMNVAKLHNDGILNEQVQHIFSLLDQSLKTLDQANTFAQKHLLRKGERWDEQEETPIFQKCKQHKDALLNYLETLEMVKAVCPTQKYFKYALCMGAVQTTVKKRLDYIADLQEKGYHFDYVVLLGGARPLLENEKADLPSHINTEAEMMKYLYDNHPKLK